MSDVDAANCLIDAWLAYRDTAAQILVSSLNLESPEQVLMRPFRGHHELVGTGWCYRTHGTGVDMVRKNGKGGIDFDFSCTPGELFAYPDWWRLCIFMRRVVHDANVDITPYYSIIARPSCYEQTVRAVLDSRRAG
ncbi:MAG: hypothetical protein U0936_23155 [Planctomycetaceae bacterium]